MIILNSSRICTREAFMYIKNKQVAIPITGNSHSQFSWYYMLLTVNKVSFPNVSSIELVMMNLNAMMKQFRNKITMKIPYILNGAFCLTFMPNDYKMSQQRINSPDNKIMIMSLILLIDLFLFNSVRIDVMVGDTGGNVQNTLYRTIPIKINTLTFKYLTAPLIYVA